MASHIGRRKFLATLGGAAAAWPGRGKGAAAMPMIGYLSARWPEDTSHLVAAFLRGLVENGYVDGENVAIEYRWALGQVDDCQRWQQNSPVALWPFSLRLVANRQRLQPRLQPRQFRSSFPRAPFLR